MCGNIETLVYSLRYNINRKTLVGYEISSGAELGNQNTPKPDTTCISVAELAGFVKSLSFSRKVYLQLFIFTNIIINVEFVFY